MDLSKLSPAPWKLQGDGEYSAEDYPEVIFSNGDMLTRALHGNDSCLSCKADAEFIVLARNAFDVMMRRKWGLSYRGGFEPGWFVLDILDDPLFPPGDEPALLPADPFTALVEADRWYTENVERTRPE